MKDFEINQYGLAFCRNIHVCCEPLCARDVLCGGSGHPEQRARRGSADVYDCVVSNRLDFQSNFVTSFVHRSFIAVYNLVNVLIRFRAHGDRVAPHLGRGVRWQRSPAVVESQRSCSRAVVAPMRTAHRTAKEPRTSSLTARHNMLRSQVL